jgi:diguanylate cyclase (GGDEF)-like protein/putative nucleotidyltransferase with HDIG domain
MAMVRAGVWLTFAICGAGAAYVAATWSEPRRMPILALFVVAALAALAIALLPTERIVRGRLTEPFFLTWSFLDVALIALIVAADGGAASPFAVGFFLPLVFAAVFYPLRSFVPVGVVDVLAFLAVACTIGDPDPAYLVFVASCLAFTAILCAWQARNHDRQRERLMHASRTDPLTSCLNRRGFEERVRAAFDESSRLGQPLSFILLDLNSFKTVNDRDGHSAGDELLCWVVDRMYETVRPMDTVGRLGGDEFAVLAPSASNDEAVEIADRLRAVLSQQIGATTGVACFPADGVGPEELYNHADDRLYEMKNGDSSARAQGKRELSWAAALARAVDVRMGLAAEHSTVVAQYAAGLAEQLGWTGMDLENLRMAAMLHDIGKVPVPDRILQKPGPLNADEYEQVKKHPEIGAEMVTRVDGLILIAPWVRHSHENFDGSGYPDGLAGEAIPLAARMLLVADAYDAMTSRRPYRDPLTHDEALAELRRHAGRQFDPRCVDAFEEYLLSESASVSRQAVG